MIKVERLTCPSPEQWETVVHGMRLPLMSHERSDSFFVDDCDDECDFCPYNGSVDIDGYYCWARISDDYNPFVIGKNDEKLMLNLAKAGASDRKFLRQLPVIMEITAPEVFWRQMDTYKLGTTANSSSQMHCLLKEPFKLSDFSFVLGDDEENVELINTLNTKRDLYLEEKDPEIKKKIWLDIVEHIPQSFNYTRCWSANYEVLLNIIKQRKNHILPIWNDLIDIWLEKIPMLKEFNEVVNE